MMRESGYTDFPFFPIKWEKKNTSEGIPFSEKCSSEKPVLFDFLPGKPVFPSNAPNPKKLTGPFSAQAATIFKVMSDPIAYIFSSLFITDAEVYWVKVIISVSCDHTSFPLCRGVHCII